MNLRTAICLIVVLCALTPPAAFAQAPPLISGRPIKSNPAKPGLFALPSVNGFMMGMADINNDRNPDLFLFSDKYNPGTFVYTFEKYSADGTPVFSEKRKIPIPFEKDTQNKSVILETKSKEVHGFWAFGNELKMAQLNKKDLVFSQPTSISVKNLPAGFSHFGVVELAPSRYLFLFSVSDTSAVSRPLPPSTDPALRHQYDRYSWEGFWMQTLPHSGIYGAFTNSLSVTTLETKPLTSLLETYYSIEGFTLYNSGSDQYVIAGTTLGNTHAYKIDDNKETLTSVGYLVDKQDQTLRNPAIHGYVTYFNGTNAKGLILSSEGGIYFYKTTDQKSATGRLIFNRPNYLLQSSADLYGTSLLVPNLTDWDGDGDLDIVSGTSLGHIWFFENIGTSKAPLFQPGVALKAGGYDIHIQPGYNQDLQGPVEARWGYASPAVYDWNGDGLPDILTGDSRGKFNVYMNTGTKTKPKLEPEHAMYLDGLDMHGAWRVKPGVAKLAEKNAYIIVDKDDEFHLYWQIDNYNLRDGGKLTIGDSIPIRANFKKGGEIGRSKILIVDWDQDGIKDLIIGTPRYGTVPQPKTGLPFRLKDNGAAVLFLRNSGTEAKPVYEYPVPMRFRGERINMGQHEIGVTADYFGPGNSLNLVVGDETGRFYFYERKDLQWDPVPLVRDK
jgi:hypothetical protein